MSLFEELRHTSQETFESESNSNVSWDVRLHSSKSGICHFSKNEDGRPRKRSNRIPIRTFPGTFVFILQKVSFVFFSVSYVDLF